MLSYLFIIQRDEKKEVYHGIFGELGYTVLCYENKSNGKNILPQYGYKLGFIQKINNWLYWQGEFGVGICWFPIRLKLALGIRI